MPPKPKKIKTFNYGGAGWRDSWLMRTGKTSTKEVRGSLLSRFVKFFSPDDEEKAKAEELKKQKKLEKKKAKELRKHEPVHDSSGEKGKETTGTGGDVTQSGGAPIGTPPSDT